VQCLSPPLTSSAWQTASTSTSASTPSPCFAIKLGSAGVFGPRLVPPNNQDSFESAISGPISYSDQCPVRAGLHRLCCKAYQAG
jgi:hypothetical protein